MKKLSLTARFYALFFSSAAIVWGVLNLFQIEFVNQLFFLTAFIWHTALLTPGLKDKVMTSHHKLSFLAVIVRMNHYLQLFLNVKRIPFLSSFIRTISPVLFTFVLFIVGGSGNILFTLLGSLLFEVIYQIVKYKTSYLEGIETNPLVHTSVQDTPPMIPSEEKTLE